MIRELFNIWKKQAATTKILDKYIKTLETDFKMYKEAVRCLRHCNYNDMQIDIYQTDIIINKSERQIRRDILTHLIMFDKAEIPGGLTIASIVIDIERIGDYMKNIADLANLHKEKLNGGIYEDVLASIEKRIEGFFEITLKAFPESDPVLARKVVKGYREVSKDCTLTTNALIQGGGEFSVSDAVTLGLYLRFLKRTGAHLFNICTSIVNPFHRIGFSEKKKKEE
ncbi:MAG: PhoU domain-containing protein [Candidatus Marinimicrobia bacterium]|nr:PhoU domain-containing protein [Candidatus Neomarinimicrobiota bacterium]